MREILQIKESFQDSKNCREKRFYDTVFHNAKKYFILQLNPLNKYMKPASNIVILTMFTWENFNSRQLFEVIWKSLYIDLGSQNMNVI